MNNIIEDEVIKSKVFSDVIWELTRSVDHYEYPKGRDIYFWTKNDKYRIPKYNYEVGYRERRGERIGRFHSIRFTKSIREAKNIFKDAIEGEELR